MSERDDTAEIIRRLYRLVDDLKSDPMGYGEEIVERAAHRLKELHNRLAVIEAANAERSAIAERYYQQAVQETRDYGND
jgi:hypothetical protein